MGEVEKLKGLLKKLKRPEGPHVGFDSELAGWLYETQAGRGLVNYDPDLFVVRHGGWVGSVDACVALMDRLLPGAMWAVGCMEGGPFCRLLWPTKAGWDHVSICEQDGGPDDEANAMLAALLSAFIAQAEQGASHGA